MDLQKPPEIFWLACLCLLLSLQPAFTSEPKTDALQLISSMKIDLDLLSTSIVSYKQKISDLESLIESSTNGLQQSQGDLTKSQADLIEQKKSLTDSRDKLSTMETRYNELKTIYDNLNYSYKRSIQTIKYGAIITFSIIIFEGIIIVVK